MTETAASTGSRLSGFVWVLMAYATSLLAAVAAGKWVGSDNLILQIAAADAVGTIGIFAFSFAFRNTSFYDPYWSVAPIVIVLYLLIHLNMAPDPRQWFALLLVAAWGFRLTFNWARSWKGLHHEDWRYVDMHQKTGKFYWLVSFAGLHFFPTVLVFLGCLPLIPVFASSTPDALGLWDIVGLLVGVMAISVETIADEQLRKFRLGADKGANIESGLWAYSRHPNYFGEASFWVALFFLSINTGTFLWWTIPGAVGMIALFVGVSIPMMEKRNLISRPGYAAYRRRVSMLVPWFPKK